MILSVLEVVARIYGGVLLEDQVLERSVIDDAIDELHVMSNTTLGLDTFEPAREGQVQIIVVAFCIWPRLPVLSEHILAVVGLSAGALSGVALSPSDLFLIW